MLRFSARFKNKISYFMQKLKFILHIFIIYLATLRFFAFLVTKNLLWGKIDIK
ncbi:hypothetical protein ABIB50_003927 [Mucilaginibacter sp. UYCu711]